MISRHLLEQAIGGKVTWTQLETKLMRLKITSGMDDNEVEEGKLEMQNL